MLVYNLYSMSMETHAVSIENHTGSRCCVFLAYIHVAVVFAKSTHNRRIHQDCHWKLTCGLKFLFLSDSFAIEVTLSLYTNIATVFCLSSYSWMTSHERTLYM